MTELLRRPELALSAALIVALLWLALGYWLAFRDVGDDPGGALDALAVGAVSELAPADRYERFSRRDYSGDRGPCPQARPRFATLYDERVARLGDPLGA